MAPVEAQGACYVDSRLAGPECGACQMIVGPVGGVTPGLCVGVDTFLVLVLLMGYGERSRVVGFSSGLPRMLGDDILILWGYLERLILH